MNIAKNNDSSQSPKKSSLKEKIMSPAKTSTEDTPQRQSHLVTVMKMNPALHDYMKPSIRAKPDHAILHIGTNDLNSNATSNEIAANIVNLAAEMKTEKCTVSISGIIIRTDKPELNKKGLEVNIILKELCMEKNFFFINHCKKIKASHLNSSKVHLNKKGDSILSNIFAQHISKICN